MNWIKIYKLYKNITVFKYGMSKLKRREKLAFIYQRLKKFYFTGIFKTHFLKLYGVCACIYKHVLMRFVCMWSQWSEQTLGGWIRVILKCFSVERLDFEAGEMTQWLRILAALAEGLGSASRWLLTTILKPSFRDFSELFWHLWAPDTHIMCIHSQKQNMHTHKIK